MTEQALSLEEYDGIHFFDSREAFVDTLTHDLAEQLNQSGHNFLLGASGGSTPIPVYQALSTQDVPWDRVTVALVDERFVPPGHEASNETAIKNSLMQNKAETAEFIGLWADEKDADTAAASADALLRDVDQPFDLLVMGMGPDGHTASLFPGALQLEQALDPENTLKVMALTPAVMPEHAPHPRLTLTLAEIKRAKKLVLAITGDEKLNVLKQAYHDRDPLALPVSALFAEGMPPLEIYWSP